MMDNNGRKDSIMIKNKVVIKERDAWSDLDGENDEELTLLTFINHERDVNVQRWKNVILNSNLFCKYMS